MTNYRVTFITTSGQTTLDVPNLSEQEALNLISEQLDIASAEGVEVTRVGGGPIIPLLCALYSWYLNLSSGAPCEQYCGTLKACKMDFESSGTCCGHE